MRPNYLVDITQKIFALIFLICSSSLAIAQNVLILYDNSPTNTNTVALKTSLQNQGFQVTISAVSESFWNNTNPSLTGFHAVIHLNGSTYATEMPIAGQTALVNFVQNEGGVYVGFEWNAYQVSESEMLTMVDLIPIVRSSGQTQNITYTTVPAQASHPVLSGIPASFSLTNTGANIGSMRAYGTDPAVTLMMQASNAGLVYRAFGTGHVLMFSHAGNYVQSGASGAALSDTIVGQLIYNMIEEYADTKKRSLNFDGTNDFVQGSDAGFPSGNSARTMEAWIKTTKNSNGSIFEYGAVSTNQRSGLLCVNNHLFFVGQNNDLEGTVTINDGIWHHVAMTHNGTTTNLYVDGVLDVTATKTLSTTPSHFRIGMRGNSISEQFEGNIDEVRLWGKALSAAEIQANANCELSGNECGLLAYYNFNNQNALSSENNAGQIVLGDSSGNGHDGALNNFALSGNSSNWVAQSDSINNSCSATLDTLAPIVFAIDTTIYLDASGNAAITVTQIDSASSDNCNIATRVLSDSTFDCTEVGTNNITLTVTDVNGNVTTATSVVTVVDSITPTTIAIDTTIYLSGAGTASVTATQIGYLSSDNCATFNLALSDSVFDCTDAGTTQTIVLTVTDPSGNTDTALAYITIVDLSAPVLITQNLTIYLDSLGAATITADSVNNGTYDSCGIASLSISTSSFTCADTGANTIDFIATDVNGNADTVQVIITVLDTQPAVVIGQNLTLQLDASGQATTTALAVDNGSFDNCGIALVSISQSTFSCADTAAPQIITLYVEDVSGNIDSTTVLMTIEDNVAPTVVTTNFTVGLDSFGFASILADSIDDGSSDNCSIESIWLDQNTFSCANVNNPVTITLFVRDVSGNINFGTAVVTVIDTIAPQIVVQNDTAYLDSMGTVSIAATLLNNGTWDSCGVNYLTLSQGAFDCSDFGTQTIIFSATDFNGNTSTANVDITILDMIAPTIIIQDLIVYLDSFGVASITADSVDIGTWDSCGMASIIIDSSSFNCANHNDTLPVIFTATDIHGNVSFDTATFYIYDTLAPFIFAHSDTFYLDSAGQYVVSYTQLNDSTSDNCGVDSMYLSDTLFTCLTVDSIVNIWFYAHDIHGNLDSLELDITMLDTIRPQFLCPDGIIVSNDFDQCGAIVSFTFPTASDNCTVDSIIQIDPTGLDSGSFFPVGFTELTYVAYDQSMNTDTCSFIIEVQDTAAPVLFCVPDTAICDTIFTFDLPSYTDNCSGFDVIQIGGIETGLFYPVGVTVNEFAVTDSYGNSDTCSFEVLRYDFPTAANAGLDQEKCEVYTATLDGNDPLVGIGIWTRIAGVGTIDDTLDNQAIISDIDTGLTALEWRIENSVCPVERDTMTIIEYVNPTAANAGLDTSICDTNEVFLTAVETDFGYGRWILPTNGATIEDTTDFQSLVTDLELGSYQFTWRIVNGVCPVTTDVVTIDVVPYPVVDAGDIKYIFLPSSIELEATSDLEVVFDWTPKSSLINDETVITTATPAVTTTYMVAGTTEFGCTSTDFVDVVVNESLDLPTAFTPDGDNFNDVWNLKELSSYPDNVVKIYNRWGNLIFESTGYQESWEGTFNGEPLPSGSYFYIIDLNVGELKPFTGSITIIK